ISHQTFRELPAAKPYDYLRNLLLGVELLYPWEPHIDRLTSGFEDQIIRTVSACYVHSICSFTGRHIVRGLQCHARRGTLTQAAANSARIRVRAAIEFCELLASHGVALENATQADLDEFIAPPPGYNRAKTVVSFVAWVRKSRINTELSTPGDPWPHATVTIGADELWSDVERLLHGDKYSSHLRLA